MKQQGNDVPEIEESTIQVNIDCDREVRTWYRLGLIGRSKVLEMQLPGGNREDQREVFECAEGGHA